MDTDTQDDPTLQLTVEAIDAAARRLGSRVLVTPTIEWRGRALEALLPPTTRVSLKLEFLQHTGTFKVRGAFHVLLRQPASTLRLGVTAISAGNHAIAVAYAARELGLSAKVVMIRTANPWRVQRCRELGAELVLADDVASGFELVEGIARDEGRFFVHPFEGVETSLGTATLGREVLNQVPDLDAVIVPIGGGGLASGVAAAVKQLSPGCAVYGVEPEGAPTMTRALAAGAPVRLEQLSSVADSLGAPFTGPVSLALCKAYLDDVVLVRDEEILAAQALAFRELKFALEPAGVTTTAGLLGPLRARCARKHVAVIMCGSNIDSGTFHQQLSGHPPPGIR